MDTVYVCWNRKHQQGFVAPSRHEAEAIAAFNAKHNPDLTDGDFAIFAVELPL
jgi:hypothetical protein